MNFEIQDQLQRLNLLFSSTHGLTSAKPGWIEFMVDRRTIHDDGRGMGEGMTDNLPIVTPFILILEDRSVQEVCNGQNLMKRRRCSVVHLIHSIEQ